MSSTQISEWNSHLSSVHIMIPRSLLLILSLLMSVYGAKAWVYSEHRDITVAAVLKLDMQRRVKLDSLWSWARIGHEQRLPASIVIQVLPETPNYIDWGSWPAIAGDHSCSSYEMVNSILYSDWILNVARIAEHFKRKVYMVSDEAIRQNAVRDQDLQLQRADPEYATRAGSNNVHFLLPRETAAERRDEYLYSCFTQGGEINALAAYCWYHYRAMAKAQRLRDPAVNTANRSKLALSALADEAFALHFLEDVFAAGHVTGTWGETSVRKGTHDYYNEHGYETLTWGNNHIVLMGDAYMSHEDIEAPARAVRTSLEQLIDAFVGTAEYAKHEFNDREVSGLFSLEPDTLNICTNFDIPGKVASGLLKSQYLSVLDQTPAPALKSGHGELPRFRAEIGGFVGLSASFRTSLWGDDFDHLKMKPFVIASQSLSLRFGFGLDGVTSTANDGTMFFEIGASSDNASPSEISFDTTARLGGSLSSIPARSSISTRIRMPFYIIPGDLILGALLIAPFSFDTYQQMVAGAVAGGFIPWQAGASTSIGRLQFVLGREVSVHFYGFMSGSQKIRMSNPNLPYRQLSELVDLRTIQVEAPIIEWRPFRIFTADQSTSLVVQFYGALDVPVYWRSNNVPPAQHNLPTNWAIGFRGTFDWRYFY
jgi:hypothetical protein